MNVETLGPEDLGRLTQLAVRCLERDDELTVAVLRRLFDDPDHSADRALCVRSGDRLIAVALGVIRIRPEGPVGYVRLLATDPEHRRRGLASVLLDELERRLAAGGATRVQVGTETPIYLFPGVDVAYTAALCLFQRRGYVKIRDTFNLSVDLVAGCFETEKREAELRANGLAFRRLALADRKAFDEYLSARWSPTWRYEGLQALHADPPSGHVAVRFGRIVGFAVYDVARPGWFGPIGTDEEQRGLGIGTVLLHRCLRDWQCSGRKSGEIAWIGPLHFYSSAANARVARMFWHLRKDLLSIAAEQA